MEHHRLAGESTKEKNIYIKQKYTKRILILIRWICKKRMKQNRILADSEKTVSGG